MGLGATKTYEIVVKKIKYCTYVDYYLLVNPIGINIFLLAIPYSLLAIPYGGAGPGPGPANRE